MQVCSSSHSVLFTFIAWRRTFHGLKYIAFQITHLFFLSSLQTQFTVNKGWGWDFKFKNTRENNKKCTLLKIQISSASYIQIWIENYNTLEGVIDRCCELTLTHDITKGHLESKHSSQVHICATECLQLVTTSYNKCDAKLVHSSDPIVYWGLSVPGSVNVLPLCHFVEGPTWSLFVMRSDVTSETQERHSPVRWTHGHVVSIHELSKSKQ